MASIFDRQRLTPRQLQAVAERRFRDAMCLLDSEDNERMNGAIYLAGFAIECLLKAQLLLAHPWLQTAPSPAGRSREEQRIWNLCYRSHDLDLILRRLPRLRRKLEIAERRRHYGLLDMLESICSQWTIFARYSPKMASRSEARRTVRQVRDLKEWLK